MIWGLIRYRQGFQLLWQKKMFERLRQRNPQLNNIPFIISSKPINSNAANYN